MAMNFRFLYQEEVGLTIMLRSVPCLLVLAFFYNFLLEIHPVFCEIDSCDPSFTKVFQGPVSETPDLAIPMSHFRNGETSYMQFLTIWF